MFIKVTHYHIEPGGWKSFSVDVAVENIAVFNRENGKIILVNNKVIDIFGPNKEDSEEAKKASEYFHKRLMDVNKLKIFQAGLIKPECLSTADLFKYFG